MAGLESEAGRLGPINTANLIAPSAPVVEGRGVAQLADAFRNGVITADDILSRAGELGKAKQKAEIQLAGEAVSPEAIQARKTAQQAATVRNQEIVQNAPLENDAMKAGLQSAIFKAQAAPGNYEAKLDALSRAGVSVPVRLETGLTPEQRTMIDQKFGDVVNWQLQQAQAEQFIKAVKVEDKNVTQIGPHGEETTVAVPGAVIRGPSGETVDHDQFNQIRLFAMSPYAVWKAHGSHKFVELLGPGQAMQPTTPSAPTPAPNQSATPPNQPTSTLYGADAQAAADAAEKAANGVPSVPPTPTVAPAAGVQPAPVVEPRTPVAPAAKPDIEIPGGFVTSMKAEQAPKPNEITDQFRKLESYKEWEVAKPYAESMMAAARAYNAIPIEEQRKGSHNLNLRDLQLAESVIKLYDPQGVVRQFKWDKIEQHQPWPDRLKNIISSAVREGTLTPETRQALIQVGVDNIRGRETAIRPYLEQAKQVAESAGYGNQLHRVFNKNELGIINGTGMTPEYTPQGTTPAASQGNAASGPVVDIPGVGKIQKVNGRYFRVQ